MSKIKITYLTLGGDVRVITNDHIRKPVEGQFTGGTARAGIGDGGVWYYDALNGYHFIPFWRVLEFIEED